ncbi:MAG: hypothetical protein AB1793_08940 [Candidatus Thermoplasmatota archaeon]
MFGSKFAMPALAVAVLGLVAVPVTIALDDSPDYDLVSIEGEVTEFVCCDEESDGDCDLSDERAGSFMLEARDGELVQVKFGPWWYWLTQEVTVRDVVAVGDRVNVTGELVEEDDAAVLEAWHIENLDTGEEITIKVEGRPPWAGGPIKLGIEPWPLPKEED